jgi:hypothetical protein
VHRGVYDCLNMLVLPLRHQSKVSGVLVEQVSLHQTAGKLSTCQLISVSELGAEENIWA